MGKGANREWKNVYTILLPSINDEDLLKKRDIEARDKMRIEEQEEIENRKEKEKRSTTILPMGREEIENDKKKEHNHSPIIEKRSTTILPMGAQPFSLNNQREITKKEIIKEFISFSFTDTDKKETKEKKECLSVVKEAPLPIKENERIPVSIKGVSSPALVFPPLFYEESLDAFVLEMKREMVCV